MGRIAVAIVVGYVAMVVWIQATYFLVQGMMGDGLSSSWMTLNLMLSFVGAYIGGSLAMRLGREGGRSAVRGFALAILIVGLGTAVVQLTGGAAELDQPSWYSFVIPFVGAGAAMLGGRRRLSQ